MHVVWPTLMQHFHRQVLLPAWKYKRAQGKIIMLHSCTQDARVFSQDTYKNQAACLQSPGVPDLAIAHHI